MKEIKNESIDPTVDQTSKEIKENNDQAADQVAEQPESLEIAEDLEESEGYEETNHLNEKETSSSPDNEDDIEPILIGIDTFKENRILGYYRDLIRNLNIHLGNIEYALTPTTPQAVDKYETREIPLSYLFGYLSSNDRKKYIREKYIERNEIEIPGISNEKLIETDLLDIPALTEEEAALNAFDKLKERFAMEHIDFAFPLSLLYRKATIDCEDNLFTETELLKEEIREHCSTYVKTREQKEVYDAVKNIADTFNSLVSFGVSMRKIESFIEWAINEDSTEKKFTVNKNLFSSFLLREVKYIRSIKERSFDFNFILS